MIRDVPCLGEFRGGDSSKIHGQQLNVGMKEKMMFEGEQDIDSFQEASAHLVNKWNRQSNRQDQCTTYAPALNMHNVEKVEDASTTELDPVMKQSLLREMDKRASLLSAQDQDISNQLASLAANAATEAQTEAQGVSPKPPACAAISRLQCEEAIGKATTSMTNAVLRKEQQGAAMDAEMIALYGQESAIPVKQ